MKRLTRITMAVAAVFALGLLTSAQAQRQVIFNTATYTYKADQVSAGSLPGGIRTVTFSGQAQTVNNKVAVSLRAVTLSVQYTVDGNGVGTVLGGTWTLVTLTKDRAAATFGGEIPGGMQVTLQPNGTLGQSNVLLTFQAGDPDWPISGFLAAALDNSKPARLSGTFTLKYPVIQ